MDYSIEGKSLLSSRDFSRPIVEKLLADAEYFRTHIEARKVMTNLEGCVIGRTIFERSTRTDTSFDVATMRGGGLPAGGRFFEGDGSSSGKGESDEDTFQTIAGYSDLMVVRHSKPEFVTQFCPSVFKGPTINAGNGTQEHPTQTLLDWYCIAREFGCFNSPNRPDFDKLAGLTIGICGDLKYGRTVIGNTIYADMFGVNVVYASPVQLQFPGSTEGRTVVHTLREALGICDIIYMTRVQRERFEGPNAQADYEAVAGEFVLDRALYTSVYPNVDMGPRVLHPMPRVQGKYCELNRDMDTLPRSVYFRQAAGGVPTRLSLLVNLLGRRFHI